MVSYLFKILILLCFLGFWGSPCRALAPEFEVVVEKNVFSPERRYVPPEEGGAIQDVRQEEIKRGLTFRGIFRHGDEKWAVIEIRPYLKRKWELEEDRKFFAEGEKIGPCEIKKIARGEVVLGGKCKNITLTLSESPERKRPAPKRSISKKSVPKKSPPSQKNPSGPKKTFPNPFKKLLQKQQ